MTAADHAGGGPPDRFRAAAPGQIRAGARHTAGRQAMETNHPMATITSKIVGICYVLYGTVGIALGDTASLYLNVLYLATGLVGTYAGFVGSPSSARTYCLIFG